MHTFGHAETHTKYSLHGHALEPTTPSADGRAELKFEKKKWKGALFFLLPLHEWCLNCELQQFLLFFWHAGDERTASSQFTA